MRRRLGKLGQASSDLQTQIVQQANAVGIPSSLALAVAQIESAFNPTAVSSAGAQGIFQLMPATAAQLGVTDPFDSTQNIQGGVSYLQQLYQQFGNWTDALAAYNWGPGNVSKAIAANPSNPAYPSGVTGYVNSVLGVAGANDATVSADGSTDLSDFLTPGDFDPTWLLIGAAVLGLGWYVFSD
jgi:soluble lytic murein transglycosylase-like protein